MSLRERAALDAKHILENQKDLNSVVIQEDSQTYVRLLKEVI